MSEQVPIAQPTSTDQRDDLKKERPEPTQHRPGQDSSAGRKRLHEVGALRHGYDRLGHMYSLGLPFKFEELQGRHPFDFVEGTKEHFKLHPDPVKRPAQPEDQTLFDIREWLEPLIRKGQLYWDYCRDKWLEKESKVGAACTPIGCMFTLWSVTDSCLQNGGLVFMTVYLILTVVFIIPFIYMELTLGQFHRQGLVKAMKQTCPLFQGVAYLMLLSSFFDYLLTLTRATWLFYYVQSSVTFTFPWRVCHSDWSSNQCKATLDHLRQNETYNASQRTPAVEWFRIHVSRPWKHWELPNEDLTPAHVLIGLLPNPSIVLCFVLLLFMFRLLMRMGCRQLGRTMGTIFFFAFAVTSFSLYSFHHSFSPDIQQPVYDWFFREDHLKYFYAVDTWTAALRHAVVSSGIGTGIYITFGSHNTFPNDDMKYMSVLSGLTAFSVHFIVGIFLILCHFTVRTSKAFEGATVKNFGSDTLFEVFPQVAAQHHQQGFAFVMYLMMTIGILLISCLRATCSLHTIRQFFIDRDKDYYEPCRVNYNYWEHGLMKRQQRYVDLHVSPERKAHLMTSIMLYAGIFHLLTFMAGGSVVLYVVEELWYNYVPMSIVFVEVIAVFFFAGIRTLNEYIRKMTSWQATLWYRFAWRTFVPFILIMYLSNPPRLLDKMGGVQLPEMVQLLGFVFAGLPLFYMYMSISHVWSGSRAKGFFNKLNLEVTPEHERAGLIEGMKPATRLHWMHHVHVPAGISRGLCLPPYDGPQRRPDPNRFEGHYRILNFFWFTLKLRWFNEIREGCVKYEPEEEIQSRHFHMFPQIPLPMKPPKKQRPFPDYLPNEAVKRVHKLKKYKEFQMQRKQWLNTKVELERERMAVEHFERDIETGIMGFPGRKSEVEDHEFFDTFDLSSEDVSGSSSSVSDDASFDPSSDNGRGRGSSPSVSTTDSFDTDNSIFRGSEEEESENLRGKRRSSMDSDSSSEDEDDLEDMLDLLEGGDNLIAPAMDYEDGVPFDDETDSWDLEDLEHLEDDRKSDFSKDISSDETDTDDLAQASNGSTLSDEEKDSDKEDEDERLPQKDYAPADKEESPETNSWSMSCASSSCSSSEESSSSEEDDSKKSDDAKKKLRDGSSDDDDDGHQGKKGSKKEGNLRFFRNMAEKLDTFLHLSKSKEESRISRTHDLQEKSKRGERR